jgi:hypothetical protein
VFFEFEGLSHKDEILRNPKEGRGFWVMMVNSSWFRIPVLKPQPHHLSFSLLTLRGNPRSLLPANSC